ncbi:MAG: hypothetical protein R2711_08350 [Acidimicrobiales bacterium]
MAFGQQSGPPATHRQLQDLLELVIAAGHVDLRDALGPLGLTQRQAAGRFTRDEAGALIERLQAEADAPTTRWLRRRPVPRPPTRCRPWRRARSRRRAGRWPPPALAAKAEALRRLREVLDHLLAAELQRRGGR